MLTTLLLLQTVALSAPAAVRTEEPRPRLVVGAQLGGAFRSYDAGLRLSRLGIAASGSLRRSGRTWGSELLVDGMYFPTSNDLVFAPCLPTAPHGCGPWGAGFALVGAIGIYARNETDPATRISYGVGAAFNGVLRPETGGPDPGGYVRLDFHPPAGRSGVSIGLRYYFLPGSDFGKHLVPLTNGIQF